jgi:hypothetical protein
MIHRLEELMVREVSPVDRGANRKRFLVIKQAGLAPRDDMDREQLRELRERRSKEFGIEVLEGAGSNLTFQKGDPTRLDQYADPVNIKYRIDDRAHAANARARFAQNHAVYSSDRSKATILERIIRASLGFGIRPGFDPDNPLDRLLPADLRERLTEKTMAKATLAPTVKADVIRMLERADETAAKVEAQVKAASDVEGDTAPAPLVAAVGSVSTILRGILTKHRAAASKADDAKADDEAEAEAADKAVKVELTIPNQIRGKVLGALGKIREGIKALRADVDAAEEPDDGETEERPFPEDMAKLIDTMAKTLDAAIGRTDKAEDDKAEDDADKAEPKAEGEAEAAAAAAAAASKADDDKAEDDADKAAKQEGGSVKEAVRMLEGIAARLTPGKQVDPAAAAQLKQAIGILRASVSGKPAEPAEDAKAKKAEDDKADETEKAGRPQMSRARGKEAMAAIATLIKVLQSMIPESERKGWPTRKADDKAAAEAEKAAEVEKAAAASAETAAELDKARTEIATLRKQLDDAERIAAPSNVDPVDKSNGGGGTPREPEGLPYDANDPEFLNAGRS